MMDEGVIREIREIRILLQTLVQQGVDARTQSPDLFYWTYKRWMSGAYDYWTCRAENRESAASTFGVQFDAIVAVPSIRQAYESEVQSYDAQKNPQETEAALVNQVCVWA